MFHPFTDYFPIDGLVLMCARCLLISWVGQTVIAPFSWHLRIEIFTLITVVLNAQRHKTTLFVVPDFIRISDEHTPLYGTLS